MDFLRTTHTTQSHTPPTSKTADVDGRVLVAAGRLRDLAWHSTRWTGTCSSPSRAWWMCPPWADLCIKRCSHPPKSSWAMSCPY